MKAIVISGGGSKGAFAVGVLKYIHENIRPVDSFDLYSGTSTGALISPLALLGEIDLLEKIYTTTRDQDVLNKHSFGRILTDISIHDATPLLRLIERNLTPTLATMVLTSPKRLFLSGVSLQTQELVHFTNQPAASSEFYRIERISTATELQRAMLASSCQPIYMQPIDVFRRGEEQFCDGGVRENTPIQVVADNGATEVVAISMAPKADQNVFATDFLTKATEILGFTIDTFGSDVGQNDYRLPKFMAQVNLYLDAVKNSLALSGVSPAVIAGSFLSAPNPLAGRPLVKLHEIRPDVNLSSDEFGGEGGLTFDPARMRRMLEMGFDKAESYFTSLPASSPIFV
ncbi:patatin-like phospholipase family protein [Larkinella soli]|uniref:patatin-like phospholipase family protein n=1 Tax=Larkinella soli TaxID=1770527 RepID=UPI000FFC5968|nr:patatin-like phospholipase family protein [Larkinella soli]